MGKNIKLNVYGRLLMAKQSEQGWELFFLGNDGKNRPANDLVVPSFINEKELVIYISDLCHEWATEKNPDVFCLS